MYIYATGGARLDVHVGDLHAHHRAHHSLHGERGLQMGTGLHLRGPVPVVHHCGVGHTGPSVLHVCMYVHTCVYKTLSICVCTQV